MSQCAPLSLGGSKKARCSDATTRYMAPSPQHGTRVRASSAAARKAARAGGDSGPARREISASESRSLVMDMDGPGVGELAVFLLLPDDCSAAVARKRRGRPFLRQSPIF